MNSLVLPNIGSNLQQPTISSLLTTGSLDSDYRQQKQQWILSSGFNLSNNQSPSSLKKQKIIKESSTSSSPNSIQLILSNPNEKIIENTNNNSNNNSYNHFVNILNPIQPSEHFIDDDSSDSDSDHSLPTFKQFESNWRVISNNNTVRQSSPLSPHNNNSSNSSSSILSAPSSPNDQLKSNMVIQWIQELANLKKRESVILGNLKSFKDTPDQQSSPSPPSSSSTSSNDSIRIPSSLPSSPLPSSPLSLFNEETNSNNSKQLTIHQQPLESLISNRYIHPAPVIVVSQELINQRTTPNSTLLLSVCLAESTNFKALRQESLHGSKQLVVDKSGMFCFYKLKVKQQPSKHQTFCLVFTLFEVVTGSNGASIILSTISSTPFSITNSSGGGAASASAAAFTSSIGVKRTKDEMDDSSSISSSSESEQTPFSGYSPMLSSSQQPSSSSPSSPMQPTDGVAVDLVPSPIISSSPSPSSLLLSASSPNPSNDPNYIDITELLVLPQKEAASRLGISESMLCKRFKECTRRKWPYRYLRKIDKVIKILNFQHGNNEMPKEEREKLEKLLSERKECLKPVKIRITGCLEKEDENGSPIYLKGMSLSTSSLHNQNNSSSSLNQQPQQTVNNKSNIQNIMNDIGHRQQQNEEPSSDLSSSPIMTEDSIDNKFKPIKTLNNGLDNILETLEMMEHTQRM